MCIFSNLNCTCNLFFVCLTSPSFKQQVLLLALQRGGKITHNALEIYTEVWINSGMNHHFHISAESYPTAIFRLSVCVSWELNVSLAPLSLKENKTPSFI